MKALRYQFSIPNYLAVRAADRLPLRRLETGKIPGLSQTEFTTKPLPSPEWIRLRPRLCGVCGSDISMLTNRSSPAMMPFVSFPVVPGHEIVADVVEIGTAVANVSVGDRVVVNPIISCELRGLTPCRSCRRDEPGLCENTAEGNLAPGMLVGFCRDIPGGWAEEMIVHRTQVFPIPETLSDDTAVLIEPFSVAVHSVLKMPPPPDAKVLIIGSGSIGLLVLAALRLLGHTADVTMLSRHPIQTQIAERFGATRVLNGVSAGDAAQQITGAKKYKPLRGKPVYTGGFDWVYDCVGSPASVDSSFRVAAPHGHVVMVGCAGDVPHIDFSFIWSREIQMTGCYVYGQEHSLPDAPHTFEVALRLLAEHPEFPLSMLVTHHFPLADWQQAMSVSLTRGKHAAIKVVFDCQQ